MSLENCSFNLQEDWLESGNQSSAISKIIYFIVLIVGIALLYFEISVEINLAKASKTDSINALFRVIQVFAIVMIIVPIVFFVLDWSSTSVSFNASSSVVLIGLSILALVSLAIIACVATLQLLIKNSDPTFEFPNLMWIPVSVLTLITIGLAVYRYKTDSIVSLPRRKIDWTDMRTNRGLIEAIGMQQAAKCGLKLADGDASLALQYYISTNKPKQSRIASIFGEKKIIIPDDRVPNIIKMSTQLLYDNEKPKLSANSLFRKRQFDAESQTQTSEQTVNVISDQIRSNNSVAANIITNTARQEGSIIDSQQSNGATIPVISNVEALIQTGKENNVNIQPKTISTRDGAVTILVDFAGNIYGIVSNGLSAGLGLVNILGKSAGFVQSLFR